MQYTFKIRQYEFTLILVTAYNETKSTENILTEQISQIKHVKLQWL